MAAKEGSEEGERIEKRLKKVDFDIRKQRYQRGSSSSSVAEVKKRLNHVAVVVAEEGEGEIGRDEIRDSRRRD